MLVLYFSFGQIINLFQESIWDSYFRLRGVIEEQLEKSDSLQTDIVILAYDLRTYKMLGDIETNRNLWKNTILDISDRARLVALDCGLTEEGARNLPDFKVTAEELKKHKNIIFPVFPEGLRAEENVITGKTWKSFCIDFRNFPDFKYGHTVFFTDADGIVRKLPARVIADKKAFEALSIEVVKMTKPGYLITVESGEKLFIYTGGRTNFSGYAGTFRINFRSPSHFKTVSFVDAAFNRVDPGIFDDAIVIVGMNLSGYGNSYLTPLNKEKLISSVYLQANAINSLSKGEIFSTRFIDFLPQIAVIIILFSSFIFSRTKVSVSAVIAFLMIIFWYFLSIYLFLNFILIDTVIVPISIVLSFAFVHAIFHAEEIREREMVANIFGKYLKPELVEQIIANPEEALEALKGTTRISTVLFADIRGFTSFCEKRTPVEVVNVLNNIFERATEEIFAEDGLIDKFIGDGIMVLFNVPYDQEDHADRAVRAAVRMMRSIEQMDLGLTFGIGINTGEVVAGNIGSSKRMDYTAIGDTVNTASRICSVAGPGEILISESTYKSLKSSEFIIKPYQEFSLKGKSDKVKTFKVLY